MESSELLTSQMEILFAKISLQQSCEACTMASLIFSHFVYGIVDSVKTSYLSILGNTELVLTSSSLCSCTLLQIGLGIPNTLSKELCKLSSVLSLFVSSLLPVETYLGIAFSVSDSCHAEIHTNF